MRIVTEKAFGPIKNQRETRTTAYLPLKAASIPFLKLQYDISNKYKLFGVTDRSRWLNPLWKVSRECRRRKKAESAKQNDAIGDFFVSG